MNRKISWMVMSGLMALSLVMAACGPAVVEEEKEKEKKVVTAVEEKQKEEEQKEEAVEEEVVDPDKPRYGGTLLLSRTSDPRTFDALEPVQEPLWRGDWAKGMAGGYGTGETDWRTWNDIFELKKGALAESVEWTVDEEKDEGTIVYTIRQGVHWALNPDSEASRLVGGREVTADDIIFQLKRLQTDPKSYVYRVSPEVRDAKITKTGPWEITVEARLEDLVSTLSRLTNGFSARGKPVPPEVIEKYGDMEDWRNNVGAGPFFLKDYVAGSALLLDRNPNYWEKDPVGPGKGNQLPYLDHVQYLIIPDTSTMHAALRTGKIDRLSGVSMEDAVGLRQTAPGLVEVAAGSGKVSPITMRTDLEELPFSDVRVRRAMHMAIDFESINQGLYGGNGRYPTFPFGLDETYSEIYLGLDDPEFPESEKELFSHNPEKAKQLLAEAGYPDGFKTSLILTGNAEIDYYSIIKDYFAKVGIDMTLDVRESGVRSSIRSRRTHPEMITSGSGPAFGFYLLWQLTGEGGPNTSMIDDPVVNAAAAEIRRAAITDTPKAMRLVKELMPYVYSQAWAIGAPESPRFTFWWPWVKNYSGEDHVGKISQNWPMWLWIDQEMKESMGY
ncbi:MAG: ABC transporter substrate-binding protein [Dehalococcoidales bacterium]|jgi:peptide/nickel transport system substrate-binding protein|nr:ABC transporter substrate-binding protein [Dehalococcoidales bacterium]MDP6633009.1 ABC transporter substrate-binding protein [Dehalococcoidales bacterium]